jgi:hypothetical protein
MPDFTKLNGTAVRTTGMYRRVIDQADGPPLDELELVIIIRGSMANRSLKQLLSQEPIQVEVPTKGTESDRFVAAIQSVQVASSGTGESAAFRYDLTLRETPESAKRRAAERPAQPATAPAPPPAPKTVPDPEYDDDPSAPLDLSKVNVAGSPGVWAAALKQLQTPPGTQPAAPPEPPLTPTELAGIEAILVNLRLDAMIDLLEIKGLLQRSEIENQFMTLVKSRFVAEATPVVGEKIAKRAERDLLG